MLCEICGENEATFHYSEVVNGNRTEHHLCSECAAKTDISYYTNLRRKARTAFVGTSRNADRR